MLTVVPINSIIRTVLFCSHLFRWESAYIPYILKNTDHVKYCI